MSESPDKHDVPTPRTDAALIERYSDDNRAFKTGQYDRLEVSATLARQLERELAEKQKTIDGWVAANAPLGWIDDRRTKRSALANSVCNEMDGRGEGDEGPVVTDDVRAALLFALWHHQGGSSRIGQPLRLMLGVGSAEPLRADQIAEAKRVESALAPSAIRDNLDRAERVLKAWADWNGPMVEDDAFSMQEQAKKYFALKNEAPQEQDEGLQHGGAERATGCSSAAHVEAASQAPSVPSPPAVASPPANWWCPTCRRSLVPSEVTYEECHDSRTGGCGMPVSTSELPSSEKDRKRLIDNAISDLAQLYGLIEEGEYDKASDYCKAAAEWYTQEIASLATSATKEKK